MTASLTISEILQSLLDHDCDPSAIGNLELKIAGSFRKTSAADGSRPGSRSRALSVTIGNAISALANRKHECNNGVMDKPDGFSNSSETAHLISQLIH